MFERFSGSYYLGRLYVEPREEETALMHSDQHERLNEHLYASGDGIERLDAPLVMKLDSTHFPVHGDDSVPADTLAVPEKWIADRVRDPPTLREVLLAKGDRARQLLRMTAGYEAPTMT